MNIDLNKAMKDCEGIEKVQERTNAGVVSQILIIIYNWIYRDKNLIQLHMKRINKSKVKSSIL